MMGVSGERARQLLEAAYGPVDGRLGELADKFATAVVEPVAAQWVADHDEAPTTIEWLRVLRHLARAAIADAASAPTGPVGSQPPPPAHQEPHSENTGESKGVRRGPSTGCAGCDGSGMVEVDDGGHGSFRACGICAPAAFDRWASGHHRSGHVCEHCRPGRRR